MPQEKENNDLHWAWFCNQKWEEHQSEIQAWEGSFPDYTQEEYIKKNKDFLLNEWVETFWPGHILVKPIKDNT